MIQLDQVTQQNAAMVEETAAAGHILNSDATTLADLVATSRISGSTVVQMPGLEAVAGLIGPAAHDDEWQKAEASTARAVANGSSAAQDMWQQF